VLCTAALGFLPWNWSPAKIFMGDVGSGFLGFAISALAVQASVDRPEGLFSWWILCGVFFADATVTLFRRLARGERPHVAHRSHSYQHLARRVGHARVTLGVIALNLALLLPLGVLAAFRPDLAGWLVLAALAPLFIAAVFLGSGRREL
jgi:Fuc2NAc and GlcNAc transferase